MQIPTRHVQLSSLLERIRPTYVDTFTRKNNDGREANCPTLSTDVRWTIRDQSRSQCNEHLVE